MQNIEVQKIKQTRIGYFKIYTVSKSRQMRNIDLGSVSNSL